MSGGGAAGAAVGLSAPPPTASLASRRLMYKVGSPRPCTVVGAGFDRVLVRVAGPGVRCPSPCVTRVPFRQQMTVLGVVSLVLFIAESAGHGAIGEETKKYIEVVHFTLFVVAVVYAGP